MRDKKFITTKITNDIIMVQLEVEQSPKFSVDKQKHIIKYGAKNDYPDYLIYLYENNPIHQGIVDTKAKYIAGCNIEAESPAANAWLLKANPFDSWHEILSKVALDKVNFNGFAVQIRTNVLGQPLQFFHMDFGKLRIDEDMDCVWYSDNWNLPTHQIKKTYFPLWKEGVIGDSIYYFKQYKPSTNKIASAYPLPEFVGATMDIDTDIEISSWCNNYVKNGFSATSIVTFFGGEPNKTEKANLADRLKTSHTGASNAGKFVLAFAPKDGKAAEISSLQPADIYQQFQEITKRNVQNTISGHRFTPILAGIQTPGELGNTSGNDLAIAEERFIKGYVIPNQKPSIVMLQKLYKAATNQAEEFEYEQVKLAGRELPIENANIMGVLTSDEKRKYINDTYGLDLVLALPAIPGQAALPPTEVDANLTGLTAKDNQDLQRIVREYAKGKMPETMAIDRIRHYGVDEAKAKKWLGIQMNVQMAKDKKYDEFITKMEACIVEIDENDEVLETKLMTGKMAIQMATSIAFELTITELRNVVLNTMKGNPFVKVEEIATLYKVPIVDVQKEINWLSEKGLIEIAPDSFTPTKKAFNKDKEVEETEIYTVYKYGLRDDVSGGLVTPTTREFCKDMVRLTSGSKRLTLSAINNKENDMDSEYGINNAFDFRGGFYNDGEETTPFCRHVWIEETRIKRKKK